MGSALWGDYVMIFEPIRKRNEKIICFYVSVGNGILHER